MTIHFHPSFTFLFNFPLDFHQCLKVCFFFSFFCFEKFHFILFSISISLFFFQFFSDFTILPLAQLGRLLFVAHQLILQKSEHKGKTNGKNYEEKGLKKNLSSVLDFSSNKSYKSRNFFVGIKSKGNEISLETRI